MIELVIISIMEEFEFNKYKQVYSNVLKYIEENDGLQDTIVFRLPSFTHKKLRTCICYIIKNLREKGTSVSYKHPRYLILKGMKRKENSIKIGEIRKKRRGRPKNIQDEIIKINDPILINIINTSIN